MKFLVTNKPHSNGHDMASDPESSRIYAAQVKELLENGTLVSAYVLAGGGYVYVMNAKDSEELLIKLRYDPLFNFMDTTVTPVVDAVDFLEGHALHVAKMG
jgi:muconolactone delta-isomerase